MKQMNLQWGTTTKPAPEASLNQAPSSFSFTEADLMSPVADRTASHGMSRREFLAAAGLVLGWKLILLAMFFAAVCAAIFGLIYMRVTHKGRGTAIRLIPFVSGGCMLALLAGARMLSAYLGLFGL